MITIKTPDTSLILHADGKTIYQDKNGTQKVEISPEDTETIYQELFLYLNFYTASKWGQSDDFWLVEMDHTYRGSERDFKDDLGQSIIRLIHKTIPIENMYVFRNIDARSLKLSHDTVNFEAVLLAIESASDEITHYYDTKTGKIVMRDVHEMFMFDDRFYHLPDRYEIHDYQIMKAFVDDVKDEKVQRLLYLTLEGKGAFRRFKDMVYELGYLDAWYQYRDHTYQKIAEDWIDNHQLKINTP